MPKPEPQGTAVETYSAQAFLFRTNALTFDLAQPDETPIFPLLLDKISRVPVK